MRVCVCESVCVCKPLGCTRPAQPRSAQHMAPPIQLTHEMRTQQPTSRAASLVPPAPAFGRTTCSRLRGSRRTDSVHPNAPSAFFSAATSIVMSSLPCSI